MTLRVKVSLLIGLILLSFMGFMIVGLYTLRIASDSDNKARVHQLFKSTYNAIVEIEKHVEMGKISDQKAKELATEILRNNFYHDSEYVYVADEKLDFVATPRDPQLHGTSFHEFKDGKGHSVGEILLTAVEKQPNGIATYNWTQKKADGSIEEKLSIAQKSPRWGWYVGTGIGFNEVNARFWSTARWQLVICVILTGIIGALVWFATHRLLALLGSEPEDVLELVTTVSAGDLSKHDDEKEADEASVYGSTIRMRDSLSDIIGRLAGAVSDLHAEIHNANARSRVIDEKFELQKQETDMVATAITEMAATSNTVSESAENAATATKRADEEGLRGQQVVQDAVNSIDELARQIDDSSDVIAALGSDVENIVSVLNEIRGIAEQTNLLALNAAIEAARAGEQGRGFAVVADEVRNLAKRTQDSTQEIQEMIERLQNGSKRCIDAMSRSKASSGDNVEQARHAAEALMHIAQSVNTITDMNNQIATAAVEQNHVCEDIAQRVNMIADSSHDAADQAREGRESTQVLVDLTDDLEKIVGHFKV